MMTRGGMWNCLREPPHPPGADTRVTFSRSRSSLLGAVFGHLSGTSFFRLLTPEASQNGAQMDPKFAENWCRQPSRKTYTKLYVFSQFLTCFEKVDVPETL